MDTRITIHSLKGIQNISPKFNSDKKKKALDAIDKLLEKEKIEFIYYVDDKIDAGQQESFFKGMMNKAKAQGHSFENKIFRDINANLPDPVFQKKIENLWREIDDKKSLIHEVSLEVGDKESSNIIPSLEIEEYFPKKLKLLTPWDWINNYESDLTSLASDKKILCLFDFELHDFVGPRGERNGADLLKSILESRFKSKVVCGIFSHKFSVEDEDDFRQNYAKMFDIPPREFYTISKTRFAYDPKLSAFSDGIKNVLSLSYLEDLKDRSISIIKESNENSLKELEAISPKTYNRIVQKASYQEGIWEVESLFRMSSILTSHHNFTTLVQEEIRQSFDESIKKIRDIDSVDTGYGYVVEDKKAVDLRTKEVFFGEDLLNKLNFPTGNGDIFRVGSKEYILLVQPCNIALRKEGKRNRGYNIGTLVPLKEIKRQKYNPAVASLLIDPELNQGNVMSVVFGDFQTIPLDILDLTVFNDNSEAIIDMQVSNMDSNNSLIPSWQKRYKYLFKEFQKEEKIYTAYEKIKPFLSEQLNGSEIASIKRHFDRPNYLRSFPIGEHRIYKSNKRHFDFKIKRLKRYQPPYSLDLLQSFMSYLSRNGSDVEFL